MCIYNTYLCLWSIFYNNQMSHKLRYLVVFLSICCSRIKVVLMYLGNIKRIYLVNNSCKIILIILYRNKIEYLHYIYSTNLRLGKLIDKLLLMKWCKNLANTKETRHIYLCFGVKIFYTDLTCLNTFVQITQRCKWNGYNDNNFPNIHVKQVDLPFKLNNI